MRIFKNSCKDQNTLNHGVTLATRPKLPQNTPKCWGKISHPDKIKNTTNINKRFGERVYGITLLLSPVVTFRYELCVGVGNQSFSPYFFSPFSMHFLKLKKYSMHSAFLDQIIMRPTWKVQIYIIQHSFVIGLKHSSAKASNTLFSKVAKVPPQAKVTPFYGTELFAFKQFLTLHQLAFDSKHEFQNRGISNQHREDKHFKYA